MDKRQTAFISLLSLLLLTLAAGSLGATTRIWESLTSFDETREILLYHDDIWTATTGGLVRVDAETMTTTTYTNVDGLQMSRLYSLYVDDADRLWVGGRGYLVDFSDPDNPDGYIFTDRDGQLVDIYDIAGVPGGDSLWLASGVGVTLFLTGAEPGGGLILDMYGRFGDIDRDTPARRVALDSSNIWVGTDGGFAVGSRDDIRLLKAPTGWISYRPSDLAGIATDSVIGLVSINDTVYVGCWPGMYRFESQPTPALIPFDIVPSPLVYNMGRLHDTLVAGTHIGTILYHDGIIERLPGDGMPIGNTTGGVIDRFGRLWSANLAFGLHYRDESLMMPVDVGGMPANECRQIIAAQGKIWGAFWRAGLAYLEDGDWHRVDSVTGWPVALAEGPLGELWVGTWGEGVFCLRGDSLEHYTHINSALSGTPANIGEVVIPAIYNSGDAVWFANYKGRDGEVVAVNPYNPEQWQAYELVAGSSVDLIESVAIGQGVIYAGSTENGIYAILYNGTPFNRADDMRWEFTSSNSGIGSDIIGALTVDNYDTLWVGTAFGLSYQSLGEVFFYNVAVPDSFGPAVNTITVDGQGSVYAGSSRGIAVRDIATGDFEHLTSRNSGLVDDDVKDIYYQPETREFWISTTGGVSRMQEPYRLRAMDVDEVLAYPNPFRIRFGDETVRFDFAGTATIRIYSAAGELVREIPVTGVWDGRNGDGADVASGVYLFTVTNGDGDVGQGKLFLIRE